MKNQNGSTHLLVVMIILVVGVIGATGYAVNKSLQKNSADEYAATKAEKQQVEDLEKEEELPLTAAETATDTAPPATTTTPPAPKPKASNPPATQPAPASTNCIPSDANQYQKTWSGSNTAGVLLSNGYTSTKKFYDALQFAGLLDTVNSAKTVTFAVNDYTWDNDLTQAQKDYLNADPANMKAMLNWHIVKSCVIWSGNIEKSTGPVSFQTLGGQVTHYVGSPGNINGAKMAMWDFFSSNGSMHLMSDFISPPVL